MLRILFSIFIGIIFSVSASAEAPPPFEENKPAEKAQPKQPGPAAPPKQISQARIDAKQYDEVISEYKKYLSTIPAPVREEIRNYRKEVIRINKQKVQLYKKLSVEAQNFLKKERGFKQRLPIKQRKKVTQAANSKK